MSKVPLPERWQLIPCKRQEKKKKDAPIHILYAQCKGPTTNSPDREGEDGKTRGKNADSNPNVPLVDPEGVHMSKAIF